MKLLRARKEIIFNKLAIFDVKFLSAQCILFVKEVMKISVWGKISVFVESVDYHLIMTNNM